MCLSSSRRVRRVVNPRNRNLNEGRGRNLEFSESLYLMWRTSPDRPAAPAGYCVTS
jgi:hypothetical protein